MECGSGGSRNGEVGSDEGGNGSDGRPESGFAELKRIEASSLPLSERQDGFREAEMCFSDAQVKQETYLCLYLEICLAQAIGSGPKE